MKWTLGISILIFALGSFAEIKSRPLPPAIQYFSPGPNLQFRQSAQVVFDSLAGQHKLEFYPQPNGFTFDALITNAALDRSIFVSFRHRANPEFWNQLYQTELGTFLHVKIGGQPFTLFFYRFPETEIQKISEALLKESQVARRENLFFYFSKAEAAETVNVESEKPSTSKVQASKTETIPGYLLGQGFIGCGHGLIEGLNDLAKFPWEAVVSASQGVKGLYQDPKGFATRSVDEFKALGQFLRHFSDHLGNQKEAFLKKPPEEKSEILCQYLGIPYGTTAATKAAKAAGYLGREALPKSPALMNRVKSIEQLERKNPKNLRWANRGSEAATTAQNEEVIRSLNVAEVPVSNPKKLAGLSSQGIDDLFKKVKENPMSALCPINRYDPKGDTGFCFGRALIAHIEALRAKLGKEQVRKLWAVGNLVEGKLDWDYHVTTIVRREDGAWFAIDPIYEKALPIEDWYKRMKAMDIERNMRIYTTEAKRFAPETPAAYSPELLNRSVFRGFFQDLMNDFKKEAREAMEKAR